MNHFLYFLVASLVLVMAISLPIIMAQLWIANRQRWWQSLTDAEKLDQIAKCRATQ